MVAATGPPGTPQVLPALGIFFPGDHPAPAGHHHAAHERILRLVAAAFDQVLDQALRTLDTTQLPILEIFGSNQAGCRGKRPLERPQKTTIITCYAHVRSARLDQAAWSRPRLRQGAGAAQRAPIGRETPPSSSPAGGTARSQRSRRVNTSGGGTPFPGRFPSSDLDGLSCDEGFALLSSTSMHSDVDSDRANFDLNLDLDLEGSNSSSSEGSDSASSRYSSDEEEEEEEEEDEDDDPPALTGQSRPRAIAGGTPPVHLPRAGWAWLTQAIFSLSIHCLATPQIKREGDRFSSALVAYTAIRSLQVGEDGQLTFYKPYNYTTILAGLVWISHMLLLEFALLAHGYHLIPDVRPRASFQNHARRATQVHQAYGGRPSFCPLTELLSLMAGGMRIVREQPQRPMVAWSSNSTILYWYRDPQGLPLALFQQWIRAMLASTLSTFRHRLLLGALLAVDLNQLTDLPTRATAGFSFLSLLADHHPGSLVAGGGGGETARPLLPFCETPGPGCQPLLGGRGWHRRAIKAYLAEARDFLRWLLLTI
ncbi:hypothetical protein BJY00DRAFT_315420 [Aspergillus carlsbadensis]|nr:hypothetical protein BJY00DRAFT_315420 [Aspergillus carlsbadensis]